MAGILSSLPSLQGVCHTTAITALLFGVVVTTTWSRRKKWTQAFLKRTHAVYPDQ